jgi:hypothetical protein
MKIKNRKRKWRIQNKNRKLQMSKTEKGKIGMRGLLALCTLVFDTFFKYRILLWREVYVIKFPILYFSAKGTTATFVFVT